MQGRNFDLRAMSHRILPSRKLRPPKVTIQTKHIESTLKNPNFSFSRVDINLIVEDSAIGKIHLSEALFRGVNPTAPDPCGASVDFL